MILKLDDVQARVADVFLMLSEAHGKGDDSDSDKRESQITTDDIAHWAGITPEKARGVVNQLASARRVELYPNKIVVLNIHELKRLVTSRRKGHA